MANSNRRSSGWLRTRGANPTLAIHTEDPAVRVPYHFGLGVNDTGRISTISRAGAALTFPDDYSFGEAWELRWTFAETGNSNKNGIFLNVRGNAANSAGITGVQVQTEQEGAVAIGTLQGGNFTAQTRSTGAGDITNFFGVTGEISHNSDAYTGTVALGAGVRAKITIEDGATYTKVYGVYVDLQPASGGDIATAAFGASSQASCSFTSVVDVADAVLVETNSGKNVTLMRFTAANGTVYRLVHDTDTATAVSVVTD